MIQSLLSLLVQRDYHAEVRAQDARVEKIDRMHEEAGLESGPHQASHIRVTIGALGSTVQVIVCEDAHPVQGQEETEHKRL